MDSQPTLATLSKLPQLRSNGWMLPHLESFDGSINLADAMFDIFETIKRGSYLIP